MGLALATVQYGRQEALEDETSRPRPFGYRGQRKARRDRGTRPLDKAYAGQTGDHP